MSRTTSNACTRKIVVAHQSSDPNCAQIGDSRPRQTSRYMLFTLLSRNCSTFSVALRGIISKFLRAMSKTLFRSTICIINKNNTRERAYRMFSYNSCFPHHRSSRIHEVSRGRERKNTFTRTFTAPAVSYWYKVCAPEKHTHAQTPFSYRKQIKCSRKCQSVRQTEHAW